MFDHPAERLSATCAALARSRSTRPWLACPLSIRRKRRRSGKGSYPVVKSLLKVCGPDEGSAVAAQTSDEANKRRE